ncbi:phosphoenolpyruvate synthase [Nocardia vermiculata]|uniref:Phosphoenolpyruvate synthase n=1 Tax=Nocardia vermiculata TaxID=257274 RepID=A0A846XTP8_9NOCA|nr:phosphoenolpyruvate synthase [Nocardia vermiculata]NKY49240.1 phosphoenolpyruvate synthase [Nocardia vermiculata]
MHETVSSAAGSVPAEGGKAAGLRRLREAALPVPDWLVVAPQLFDRMPDEIVTAAADFVRSSDVGEALERGAKLRAGIMTSVPPPALVEVVGEVWDSLDRAPVAVRSSAAVEDGTAHSFAGQFDSFLNVSGAEPIATAVLACWASALSPRVIGYCFAHGLPLPEIPSVIVQKLVDAECSGVLFTCDPNTGASDRMLLSAVYGLGEGLVSGAVDADTHTVDKVSGAVVETVVGDKELRYRADGEHGCTAEEVEPELRGRRVLSAEQIRRIIDMGRSAEEFAGAAQDIEWAFDGADRLWVVQARPVTTAVGAPLRGAGESVPAGEERIWDNSNIIESFNGITSPLTFTTAADIYGRVYRDYARSLGVPPEQLRQTDDWTPVLLGYFHGRVYYNLLHWYRMVGIAPGYPLNRRVLEAALGVAEPLPSEVAKTLRPFTFGNPVRRLVSRARTAVIYRRRIAGIDAMMRDFLDDFYRVYDEFEAHDDSADTGPQAYARYRELDRELVHRWGPMMVLDAMLLTLTGALFVLTRLFLPKAPEWFLYAVAGPGADVESAEPARAMSALAERVRAEPHLRTLLESSAPEQAYDALAAAGHDDFRARVDEYIDRYGYRSVDELKLETPDLREDPSGFFVMLLAALPQTRHEPADDAQRYLDENLTGWRRSVYERLRRKVSRCAAHRETLRFCRTRAFGMVKRTIRVMGRDLVQRNIVDEFSDVFQLTLPQLRSCYEGGETEGLRSVVAARKQQRAADARLAAPARFVTHGDGFGPAELASAGWAAITDTPAATAGAVFTGTPSGGGTGTGPAVVVDEPRDVAGGVLVTYRTDPGWVAVLPSATALVIERGSPLTHVAIVARELGVPTVVQLPGITRTVRTGMPLHVDGTAGTVTVLESGEEPDAQ